MNGTGDDAAYESLMNRAAKKRKHDCMSTSSTPNSDASAGIRKKHPEFWFEDGNIILVAQDVEFKVYKCPLIKQSPVFRDMLSLPQGPDSALEGALPVVHLSDHPHDIKWLLECVVFGKSTQ